MFGISPVELLVILVIALVIIGPKNLPEVARTLGKGFYQLRNALDGVRDSVNLDKVMDNMMKEEPKASKPSPPSGAVSDIEETAKEDSPEIVEDPTGSGETVAEPVEELEEMETEPEKELKG